MISRLHFLITSCTLLTLVCWLLQACNALVNAFFRNVKQRFANLH